MVNPELLALVGAMFLVLLAPTRRLQGRGWAPRALGSYLATMIVLGVLVVWASSAARYLVPIFVVGYVLPFVRLPARRSGLGGRRSDRGPGRQSGRPPMKIVHGPARDVPPADRDGPSNDEQRRSRSV